MFSPDTRTSGSRLKLLASALAIASGIVAPATPGELAHGTNTVVRQQGFPDSPGRQTTEMRCLNCHGVDIINEQRLSKAAWTREVAKMIEWGASVDVTETDEIVAYLSAQFGLTAPSPALSRETEEAGRALLPRCLVCHDLRLIERQQLTPAGWTREIDRMVGWGAALTDAESNLLSEFLAGRYGPKEVTSGATSFDIPR